MEKLRRIKSFSFNNDNRIVKTMELESSHTVPANNVTFDKFRKFLLHHKPTKRKKSELEFDSDTVNRVVKDENSLSDSETNHDTRTTFLRQRFHSLRNSFRVNCGKKLRKSFSKNRKNSRDENNNNYKNIDNNKNVEQKCNGNFTSLNNNDDSVRLRKNNDSDDVHILSTKCVVNPR